MAVNTFCGYLALFCRNLGNSVCLQITNDVEWIQTDLSVVTKMPRKETDLLPLMPRRLRELRQELGWSLNDVAQRLNVTQRAVVSNWEAENQRRRVPDIQNLLVLQRWYGVSMDYLMGQPGAEHDSPVVRAGKAAIRESLRVLKGIEATAPHERAHIALSKAMTIAPDAFFRERVAAFLMITPEHLDDLLKHGNWSEEHTKRLADILGLHLEWFYSPEPHKVLTEAAMKEAGHP